MKELWNMDYEDALKSVIEEYFFDNDNLRNLDESIVSEIKEAIRFGWEQATHRDHPIA